MRAFSLQFLTWVPHRPAPDYCCCIGGARTTTAGAVLYGVKSSKSDTRISAADRCLKVAATGSNRRIASIEDVVSGEVDVRRWTVKLAENGEEIGKVHELIPISNERDTVYQYVLRVLHGSQHKPTSTNAQTEFLIPLVEAIVKVVDRKERCLIISPPGGLLALGRRPEKLERLRAALFDYLKALKDSQPDAGKRKKISVEGRMPTRLQLMRDGRHDLVHDTMDAGGFLSVAEALNLRASRRPDGFWENLEHVDAAIEEFIQESWTKIMSKGETYYYNEVTKEISPELPAARCSTDHLLGAVMPRQINVITARKWDLHHAVRLHGGYKIVAQELSRQPVPTYTLAQLIVDLKSFMQEHGMTHFPRKEELRAQGRPDLVYPVCKFGGFKFVAKEAGFTFQVNKHRQTFPVAVEKLKSYMCSKLPEEESLSQLSTTRQWDEVLKAGLKLPTISQVEKDGRTDLRYVLKKFGHLKLAKELTVDVSSTRGRRRRSKDSDSAPEAKFQSCEHANLPSQTKTRSS